MKYIKYIVILIILCGIGAGFLYFKNFFKLEKKSVNETISSLQLTKEIDRFYTGVYHIPVIDFERGALKRTLGLGDKVVKGCCSKKYEVAFGYDHLKQILQNEPLIAEVCAGKTSSLPDPEILAINCKSTSSFGKYDSNGACYSWDSDDSKRKSIIRNVLREDDIMDKVNERGKQSLKNLLSAFCH